MIQINASNQGQTSAVSKPLVLLLEDERSIRDVVCERLEGAGYVCVPLADGAEGLRLLRQQPFDLLILDLMLPRVDGLTICRTVRMEETNRDLPILMLTARRNESDKVLGLEAGADDYVTKPFGMNELISRLGALRRRSHRARQPASEAIPPRVVCPELEIDTARHRAVVRGCTVALTPHEFELLYQLASSPGVVRTRQELLSTVWRGDSFVTERSVDTLVRHLRCKIERNPGAPELVLTVRGYGYSFRHD